MHRKQQVSQTVYQHLFPNPRPNDPTSFSTHLSRNLVPEVRIEVATFYGTLDSNEARYPGLNYTYGPHRKRLGRFQHHAKLFKAFDELGLTDSEIIALCRWEGTLWARERYERDEGITVKDTTGDEIGPWVDPRTKEPKAVAHGEPVVDEPEAMQQDDDDADMDEEDEEDDEGHNEGEEPPSVDLGLEQRLQQSAADADPSLPAPNQFPQMSAEWEQYWKEQAERDTQERLPADFRANHSLPVGVFDSSGTQSGTSDPTSSSMTLPTGPPSA